MKNAKQETRGFPIGVRVVQHAEREPRVILFTDL
jgi:hypothetical protein